MKRVVITGGSGHIGNNLVRALYEKHEYHIKLLLLPNEEVSYLKDICDEIAYGDVLDKDFLRREIEVGDNVIHLAGIIDISSDDKSKMYDVNVKGTQNIADVALEKKCERFIYSSSVHIILEEKDNQPMREPTIFQPYKLVGDYAKSKCMATKYVFDKVPQGLNAIVIYPGGVFGPHDYKLSNTGKLVVDIANEDIGARVNGSYNFVDVRDVAEGIILALQRGKIGEGYMFSGVPVTVDEIFKKVQSNFPKRRFIPKIAMWFVKLFAGLAELHYKLRKQKPLFTKYSLYTLTSNHNFDCSKAQKELGWEQRNFDKTVDETLQWLIRSRSELFKPKTLEAYYKFKEKKSDGNKPAKTPHKDT